MTERNCLLAFLLAGLAACTAAGVPYSGNPATRLNQAMALFDDAGRPLPAEPLIVDAIADYRKAGDDLGLANAYRAYGLFFRSRALGREGYAERYRDKGFIDPEASFDKRYERAMHYFGLSEELYRRADRKDMLSNVYFHMGDVSVLRGDNASACEYYGRSQSEQAAFRVESPAAQTAGNVESFDQVLRSAKAYAKCP